MAFKVEALKRRGANYEYVIRGDIQRGFLDFLPAMLRVSKHSVRYKLAYDMPTGRLLILDRGDPNSQAVITLESTLIPGINKLRVFDSGIGKQMIEKYIRSIER